MVTKTAINIQDKPRVRRQRFELNIDDQDEMNNLLPVAGQAFAFWRRVAWRLGIDPATIIGEGDSFTALPVWHGKHWCYPQSLLARHRPNGDY